MELVKKLGLMFLGGSIATIIIFGYFFNQRISNLEKVTNQIVQIIQQSQQQQAKPEQNK